MIKQVLTSGLETSYVLKDSCFTLLPLVKDIVEQGLDVIGIVKETKQRYNVNDKMVSLKQLYCLAVPVHSGKGVLHSIQTTIATGHPLKWYSSK